MTKMIALSAIGAMMIAFVPLANASEGGADKPIKGSIASEHEIEGHDVDTSRAYVSGVPVPPQPAPLTERVPTDDRDLG